MRSVIISLAVAMLPLAGCGTTDCEGGDCGHEHATAPHVHATEGPHHGQLVELGNEEYHAELVNDEPAAPLTVYVLDSEALNAVAAAAEGATINVINDGAAQQYPLAARPQLFDASGESSRFVLTEAELIHVIDHGHAQLVVRIAGKQYRGTIEHHEHAHAHDDGHNHESILVK